MWIHRPGFLTTLFQLLNGVCSILRSDLDSEKSLEVHVVTADQYQPMSIEHWERVGLSGISHSNRSPLPPPLPTLSLSFADSFPSQLRQVQHTLKPATLCQKLIIADIIYTVAAIEVSITGAVPSMGVSQAVEHYTSVHSHTVYLLSVWFTRLSVMYNEHVCQLIHVYRKYKIVIWQ